jgi:hypothetical protein
MCRTLEDRDEVVGGGPHLAPEKAVLSADDSVVPALE